MIDTNFLNTIITDVWADVAVVGVVFFPVLTILFVAYLVPKVIKDFLN